MVYGVIDAAFLAFEGRQGGIKAAVVTSPDERNP